MKYSKFRKDTESGELIKVLVNKSLEKHSKTFEDVKDTEWFYEYTMTEQEEDEFKNWIIEYLRKEYTMPIKKAKGIMNEFIGNWGLTIKK